MNGHDDPGFSLLFERDALKAEDDANFYGAPREDDYEPEERPRFREARCPLHPVERFTSSWSCPACYEARKRGR